MTQSLADKLKERQDTNHCMEDDELIWPYEFDQIRLLESRPQWVNWKDREPPKELDRVYIKDILTGLKSVLAYSEAPYEEWVDITGCTCTERRRWGDYNPAETTQWLDEGE